MFYFICQNIKASVKPGIKVSLMLDVRNNSEKSVVIGVMNNITCRKNKNLECHVRNNRD